MKRGTIQKGTIRGTTEGRFVETTTTTRTTGTILVNRRLAVLRRAGTRLNLGTRLFSPSYALWNPRGLVQGRRSRRWRRGSRRPRRRPSFPHLPHTRRRASPRIVARRVRSREVRRALGEGIFSAATAAVAADADGSQGALAAAAVALRALVADDAALDAGERAAAEAMLRDEDRRGDDRKSAATAAATAAEAAAKNANATDGGAARSRSYYQRMRRAAGFASPVAKPAKPKVEPEPEPEPVDTSRVSTRRNRGFGTWVDDRGTIARRRFGRARVARGGDGIVGGHFVGRGREGGARRGGRGREGGARRRGRGDRRGVPSRPAGGSLPGGGGCFVGGFGGRGVTRRRGYVRGRDADETSIRLLGVTLRAEDVDADSAECRRCRR